MKWREPLKKLEAFDVLFAKFIFDNQITISINLQTIFAKNYTKAP
jgi:hypothetical protein